MLFNTTTCTASSNSNLIKNRISTKFKNSNYFGSLVWEGNDVKEATLLEIAKHVKFQGGDTLKSPKFCLTMQDYQCF